MRRFLVLVFSLIAFGLIAPSILAKTQKAPETEICQWATQNQVPGVAVAAFNHTERTDTVCGSGDAAKQISITRETVFEAASLGKPVFAYAVLKLVEEGRLNLNLPLLDYLGASYVHMQDPFRQMGATEVVTDPRIRTITARMVLSHTSGLPNWARKGPLTFTADAGRWQYSGEGFLLLQRTIEHIVREPLDEWIRDAVFEPLGMQHSSFVWKPEFQANSTVGFYDDGKPVRADDLTNFKYPIAAATLYTTLDDYSRFVRVLLKGNPTTWLMFSKQVTVNAAYGLSWGLGVGIAENDGKVSYFHYGDDPGFKAFLLVEPREQKALVMLTNSDNGEKLEKPIVLKFFGPRPHALDAPELWH